VAKKYMVLAVLSLVLFQPLEAALPLHPSVNTVAKGIAYIGTMAE
jgi:hypothetical protein